MQDTTGSKFTTRKENILKEDTYELQMLINWKSLLRFVNTLEFFKGFGKQAKKQKRENVTTTLLFGKLKL